MVASWMASKASIIEDTLTSILAGASQGTMSVESVLQNQEPTIIIITSYSYFRVNLQQRV